MTGVEAVIALGANLGDRVATLRVAVEQLDGAKGIVLQGVSAVFETDPVGGPEQPDYLNAVAIVHTMLTPPELLAACHEVEQSHGRARKQRWAARTLDLDLIVYGRPGSPSEVVSDDPALTLPHPRAHHRAFVLAPWLGVQPDAELRLPGGAVRAVRELLSEAPDLAGVRAVNLEALR